MADKTPRNRTFWLRAAKREVTDDEWRQFIRWKTLTIAQASIPGMSG